MAGTACVLAPDPLLTITVEAGLDGDDEIHLHAGGQGFWVGRLIQTLGLRVTLCAPFGGESGLVVRAIIEQNSLRIRAVDSAGHNGAYVHDRRHGERETVAEMPPTPLSRHEVDELYGAVLVAGLESGVCVLGGPGPWEAPVIPPDIYRRLATDLRANRRIVVADLWGEPLACALEGGLTVLKVSDEELTSDGWAGDDSVETLVEAMRKLHHAGAEHVLVTRGESPALALTDGSVVEIVLPPLEPVDDRGAGDSVTAGVAAGLGRGLPMEEALRLGAAAGVLNVTRRGLGTGERREIERLAGHIELRPVNHH